MGSDLLFRQAETTTQQSMEAVKDVIQDSLDWGQSVSFAFAGTICFFCLATLFVKMIRES